MKSIIKNAIWVLVAAAFVAACTPTGPYSFTGSERGAWTSMYAAMPNERFRIPALDLGRINSRYLRQEVTYPTTEKPGTIIVDTPNRFLYLVLKNGKAMRYGVGVGREGYSWAGRAHIGMKRKWPTWTPPAEMIKRQPELAKFRNGQPPGLNNPLGARALYIYKGNRDTLYRLHGTNEPWSIGRTVSSGCIRLFNQDIIDLYNRVSVGARIVVIPDPRTIVASASSHSH